MAESFSKRARNYSNDLLFLTLLATPAKAPVKTMRELWEEEQRAEIESSNK
jgi:hypothetical protein